MSGGRGTNKNSNDFFSKWGEAFKNIWNDGYDFGDLFKSLGTVYEYPISYLFNKAGSPELASLGTMDNINTALGTNSSLTEQANDSYKAAIDYEAAINQASADRAMQFEAEQAQLNRDFQERMSNTQYQRAFQDMQKAGINPMLMLTQLGGASTPAGSTASGAAANVQAPDSLTKMDALHQMATTAFSFALLLKVFKQLRILKY